MYLIKIEAGCQLPFRPLWVAERKAPKPYLTRSIQGADK